MKYYVEHVKDAIGNNYLGIKIDNLEVLPFLDKLRSVLSKEDYDLYTGNQQARDHGAYHMTIINVMDYNRLAKIMGVDNFVKALQPIFEYEIDDLEMLGVGKAEAKGNTAYFVVCLSDKLDALRSRFELSKHDFHITLGFNMKDVFGIPKNEILL
jgi:hypothetical protein